MAVATKGTELFVLAPTTADPSVFEILKIECPKNFNMGDQSISEIETTCLDAQERSYIPGLQEPNTATFNIDADPRMSSHLRLYQFFDPAAGSNGQVLKFALGWPDGKAEPTVTNGSDDFTLPTSRTWLTFQGYVSGFPFNFEVNAAVATTVSIRRSGSVDWLPKA